MRAIYFLIIGWGVCVMSSLVFGILLRIRHSKKTAENTTRIMHLIVVSSITLPLILCDI